MKVITEAILRDELRANKIETYYIPEGKFLSPAAKEYLMQLKIKIEKGKPLLDTPKAEILETSNLSCSPKYEDYATGAFYLNKPEHMTQIFGNKLVCKDHPRILFRGKLDSLQSLVVLNQSIIAGSGKNTILLNDLDNILYILRSIMRCDVLDEPLDIDRIIGLTHDEIREHSHNPEKFYNIKQMLLPDYRLGEIYALLNQIRSAIRECEVCATSAYKEGEQYRRIDILQEFNRLSSAMHIMMCKFLAGEYNSANS